MDLVSIRKKAKDRQKEKDAGRSRARSRGDRVGEAKAPTTVRGRSAKSDPEPSEPQQAEAAPAKAAQPSAAAAPTAAAPEAPETPEPKTTGEDEMAPQKEQPKVPAAAPMPRSDKRGRSSKEDGFGSLKDVLVSQHEVRREDEEEEVLQILTFMLGREEYALNIMDIKEIVRPKDPTEVPKTPSYVLGIISLRGTIIPIFDVNRRLGLPPSERSARNRVIVVKWQEHLFGLLVDSVVQVVDLPLSRIEPPPEVLAGVEGEFLRGVGKMEDRLIILLNLGRILALESVETHSSSNALEA